MRKAKIRSLLVLIALAFPLSGCGGVLDPKGPIGAAEKTILVNSLFIMLAIVLPTIVAILGFAWWFRDTNTKARYRPDFSHSGQIELVVWSIPTLTIIFLGGITWIGSHQLDPARPLDPAREPLEIQVVSLDWKWLFIYPEQGVASVNEAAIPTGRPVRFLLTSSSVMNAFFVPQLGSMIYTMNGMTTQLNLQADHAGDFPGLSSHYSGDGFSDMHFTLRAMDEGGFAGWVQKIKDAGGPRLDRQSYAALAEQTSDVKPSAYSDVSPGLFQAVVIQSLPPGPGPKAGSPAPEVSPRQGG